VKIPMVDLNLQHRRLQGEIEEAIRGVMEGGKFILGPNVRSFEEEAAQYLGVKHAIGVASGTDALRAALTVLGIGPGDEVITTGFSFIAAAEAIASVGAIPVFADIDPDTYNLAPASLLAAVSSRTKAILPVHLFGLPADLEPMLDFCGELGLPLVEDCAQSFGARFDGRMTGSWGALGCFSFFPSKNLGGCGDGGMVVTGDEVLAEKVRAFCNHGSLEKYRHRVIGINSRLDELQAAILRVKLKYVDSFNEARRKNARLYTKLLAGVPVIPPVEMGQGAHVYHQYTIRSACRDRLRDNLGKAGIASAVHYPVPLHRQEVFRAEWAGRSLPAAEQAALEVLSLPIFPEMTEEQIASVCRTLREAAG